MDALGFNLGFLLVQILNLVLVVGLPLTLALVVYRWMTGISQRLMRREEHLQSLDDHLEEVLDYLAEKERP